MSPLSAHPCLHPLLIAIASASHSRLWAHYTWSKCQGYRLPSYCTSCSHVVGRCILSENTPTYCTCCTSLVLNTGRGHCRIPVPKAEMPVTLSSLVSFTTLHFGMCLTPTSSHYRVHAIGSTCEAHRAQARASLPWLGLFPPHLHIYIVVPSFTFTNLFKHEKLVCCD
jgi:hypothetical protein